MTVSKIKPYNKDLDPTKKKPLIFLEIQSKHGQTISSRFPKSFTGDADLVMFYDFFMIFRCFFRL